MAEPSEDEWWKKRHSPLAEKLGMELVSADRGSARYLLPFDTSNTTIEDVVHGGAILSLADSAATAAIWSTVEEREQYRGLTIDLSLSFVSAARGIDLIANARVLKRGRSISYCDVDVETDTGVLIAKAKVAYKLSRVRAPSEIMASLFEDKTMAQQMMLLAELERTGADVYRAMAAAHEDASAQEQLLASAAREEVNADVLINIAESDNK
ncbi:MAG: PaaI family thioesterase [Gammaproteobacteria bacterium]|nr:PaaI family thioesterase [Gammaproteobacteria bacterium]